MLSGMNPKIQNRHQEAIDAWLADGNSITMVKARKTRRHTTRTKSHNKGGGRWGSYNVGGSGRIAAQRKSS